MIVQQMSQQGIKPFHGLMTIWHVTCVFLHRGMRDQMALIFALFCERIVTVRIGTLVEFVTVLFDEDSLPLSLVRFFCFLGEKGVVGTVEVSSTLILLPSFFLLTIIVILFIGSKLVRLLGTLGSLLLLLL